MRGRALSLRWKAFLALLGVLLLLQAVLGWQGYEAMTAQHQRAVAGRMDRTRQAFRAALDRAATEGELLINEFAAAAAAGPRAAFGPSEMMRNSELFNDVLWARLFDLRGKPIASWDAHGRGAVSQGFTPDDLRHVLQSAEDLRPRHFLVCADECVQHVFVPIVDRNGRGLIAALGDPIADTTLDFRESRVTEIVLLSRRAAGAADRWQLWGAPVLLATDARNLLPLLRAIEHVPRAGELIFAEAGGRYLALAREPLDTQRGTPAADAIFVVDETAERAALAAELRHYLAARLLAMSITLGTILVLLTAPMRRLNAVTRALPMLAEQRFDEARRAFAGVKSPVLSDEVEVLRNAAEQVTERLQRLIGVEAASAAKSQFLATMSHEIRTPINGLLGLLELHEATDLDDAQRESVRIMRESALALLAVIDDVLDLSKIEAGQLRPESVPLSLRECIEGALDTLAASASSKGLRLTCFVDPWMPAKVLGDPVRLRQIVLNLCSNAIKFTEHGRVSVELRAADPVADPLRVRGVVRDTGIGIPVAAQARLFQPFSQADTTVTRRYGGSGLGLSIVKGLVERMGGSIGFASTPGAGSEFWFEVELPLAAPAPADPLAAVLHDLPVRVRATDAAEASQVQEYLRSAGARPVVDDELPELVVTDDRHTGLVLHTRGGANSTVGVPVHYGSLIREAALLIGRALPSRPATFKRAAAAAGWTNKRVLVAEDHPTNRLVLRQQLQRLGVAADLVADGRQALANLGQREYALLIADLHMPEMDGISLVQEVRRREAGTGRRLPVLALTADALPATVDRCRAAGMDEVLRKPASLDLLRHELVRWLGPADAPKPAVDRAALVRLMGTDDPAVLGEVLAEFTKANRDGLEGLAQAVQVLDEAGVRQLAHRLCGSARMIGAADLAAAAGALESAAQQRQAADFAGLHREITREYERVRLEIANAAGISAAA